MRDKSELKPHPFCQTVSSSAEPATSPYGTCTSKSASEGGTEALRGKCALLSHYLRGNGSHGRYMYCAGSSSPLTFFHRTASSWQGLTLMNGERRAEHARRRETKGATSLMVRGDEGSLSTRLTYSSRSMDSHTRIRSPRERV